MSDALVTVFEERFGQRPCRRAAAPGRVNLIGEHTDYNDGFVLPVAIDRYVTIAYAPRDDGELCGYSVNFREEKAAAVSELAPRSGEPSWFDYAAGVFWALGDESPSGLDFVVSGDVPVGAGLSSSAALELAVARALFDASGIPWDPKRAAIAGQRVENEYIGLRSGIMDQMISALARSGSAMLLDCRSLEHEMVPLPQELGVVIVDTGTRRTLADSAYNDRRGSCERALAVVRERLPEVRALRDVSENALDACRGIMDATTFDRALHVIRENRRTLEMARALERADTERVAELMAGSHRSLGELYQVSSPELDRVVEIATAHPRCCGARMTGAGFGGCAVALVRTDGIAEFVDQVQRAYPRGELYPCRAVNGARLI